MANEFDCLLQLIMLAKHHARCRACRPDPDAPTLALNYFYCTKITYYRQFEGTHCTQVMLYRTEVVIYLTSSTDNSCVTGESSMGWELC